MPFPLEYKFISVAEEQLGFKFPEKYKAKMQIENGGEFGISFSDEYEDGDDIEPWWLFSFQDTSDVKRTKRTMNHLIAENKTIREIEGFPENSIAIAYNHTGDYLLMRAEESLQLSEEIYLRRHEYSDFISLAANSIEDFLAQ